MHKLTEFLYQGDVEDAIRTATHDPDKFIILYLGLSYPSQFITSEAIIVHIPMRDEAEYPYKIEIIQDTIHMFQKWGKKLLVACDAGLSRSPCMCLLYLAQHGRNHSWINAEKLIREKNLAFLPEISLLKQIEDIYGEDKFEKEYNESMKDYYKDEKK